MQKGKGQARRRSRKKYVKFYIEKEFKSKLELFLVSVRLSRQRVGETMQLLLIALITVAGVGQAMAGEHVWRYVDQTGQVTYSNVQVKGQKGEKVDIMPSPTIQPMTNRGVGTGNPASGPVPIPPEVLRQLQGEKGGVLPSGLPPLPKLPSATSSTSPVVPRAQEVVAPEPKWAKEVPVEAGQQPAWAKDPFAQK